METSQKADSSQDIPPCRTCSSARSSPSQAERTEVDLFVLMPRHDHGGYSVDGRRVGGRARQEWGGEERKNKQDAS